MKVYCSRRSGAMIKRCGNSSGVPFPRSTTHRKPPSPGRGKEYAGASIQAAEGVGQGGAGSGLMRDTWLQAFPQPFIGGLTVKPSVGPIVIVEPLPLLEP